MAARRLHKIAIARAASFFRSRLSARLIPATLAMLVLSAIGTSVYHYQLERRALIDHLGTYLAKLAETAASAWADVIVTADRDYTALDEFTEQFGAGSDQFAFVRVELADGRVISQWPRELPASASAASEVHTFSAPIPMRRAASPGRVVLGVPVARLGRDVRDRAFGLFLESTIAVLVVALAMLWMLRRMVGDPLRGLDAQAQKLARGDLDSPIALASVDELGRLAATLDRMRVSLKGSHEALAAQNSQLRVVDRLKSEFLANTSHEIRTPLNSIIGCADMLSEPGLAEGDRRSWVDVLKRNSVHLLAIVNDVLDLSKIESGQMLTESTPTDPRAILDDVIRSVQPRLADKPVALSVVVSDAVPGAIRTDPTRLRQVLLNVLDNAAKFTERGTITAHAELVDRGREADPLLRVVVADTGIGIDLAAQARMFQAFTQSDGSTTRRFGGTGLGLAISKRLASLMGGDLTLTSAPGSGTTVTLTVNAGRFDAALPPVSATPVPATRLAGRVLLVEDGLDNRRLIGSILRKAGLEVEEAVDGQVACDMVAARQREGAAFDLIVMDLQMPVMDGVTATRRLRESSVRTPILALTANAVAGERDRCLAAGCDAFMTKPVRRADLLSIVASHLRSGGVPPGGG